MAQLALVRHGESEWNAKNWFTGWVDEPLTEKGILEAQKAAEKLRGVKWDRIFESDLWRARQTTEVIVQVLNLKIPITSGMSLRERNYGVYTGKNKFEVEKQLGKVEFDKLHRGWDRPISSGESLKQVYERVVPYFEAEILPHLEKGENVIISAHHNSLRALCKYLKNISDKDIESFEIATGEVVFIPFRVP